MGAGVIGCEFASFFAELGTQITMVEMMPQMLPLEDTRLAKQFQGVYRKRGIQVLLNTKVERSPSTRPTTWGPALRRVGGHGREGPGVGRPEAQQRGHRVEAAGVRSTAAGYIMVNEYLETTAPGIYAIGDVNGGMMLAHVASHEAFVAVDNCLGAQRESAICAPRPRAPTPIPEVASVGLNEEQAASTAISR